MKIIREGLFETNSSSVHSITIMSERDYENWENSIPVHGKYTYIDLCNGEVKKMTSKEHEALDYYDRKYLKLYEQVKHNLNWYETKTFHKGEFPNEETWVALAVQTEDM